MQHSPMILISRLRRSGLSLREIAQRTQINGDLIRRLARGTSFDSLSDEQVGRFAALAREVGMPARMPEPPLEYRGADSSTKGR